MDKRRRNAIDKLDDLVRDKILAKHPNCLLSGKPATEVHHYIHKSRNMKYRFDERNLLPVSRIPHGLAEKGEIPYSEVVGKALYWDIISEKELEEIENDNTINKIYTHELEDMVKELT